MQLCSTSNKSQVSTCTNKNKGKKSVIEVLVSGGKILGRMGSGYWDGKNYWITHYCSSHQILLVGEGDYSFSACLARAFGSANNMVATSLDTFNSLYEKYDQAFMNLNDMRRRGCTVLYGIDVTCMADDYSLSDCTFDRIIFNFPYADCSPYDSWEIKLSRHRDLVRQFFRNAKELLEMDGEVHVTHKTNSFHNEWDLQGLAKECDLELIEEVDFDLGYYPGYINKYGNGLRANQSFDWYPSKTYKFCHAGMVGCD